MRICFIGGARYRQPLDATSEKKWRLLSALGEMFVIGFSQDLKPRRFTQHAHFYLLPKFSVPALRYLAMFMVGPFLALWLIARHGVRILVAQSPYEAFAAAVAKGMAKLLRRRVALIVESHGDFEEGLFLQRRVRTPGLYRLMMRAQARFALRHADLLRAVSNTTRDQLQRWMPGRPVVQYPAWTDIEAFFEAGAREVPREPEVLYAGVLIPLKGVHHLIGAFARVVPEFPWARLIVVGRADNQAYAAELKRRVAQAGLDGRVAFAGELPQAELALGMRRAGVFVLPSLSEGLGRVVVEAMATGTPVIGSQVGGIAEIVEDGVTGFLVPPGDEAALADRLRRILANPVEARTIGKRARQFARSFFSIEAYVNGYRRLFAMADDILQGRRTERARSAL